MARGNVILLNGTDPKGRQEGGFIAAGETPKPGTIMQVDPTIALRSGCHTFKLYNRDADGDRPLGPFYVLLEDTLQAGRDINTAYAAGEYARFYPPLPGDELNLLKGDVAGTGDDFALGDILMVDDSTGKVVLTTGSPETEVAVCQETVTDPVADQLVWCRWSGH